ncbi:MAG: dTDP-glucose 4,6-dehydratase [Ruminiclostridium sp.]|nr:dTDP-glucose 4,6-dehydratase [Ruminiclostridium sp.]
MTILVTGGAGFIGSNFIFYMMKKYPDYRIVCLDSLTYAGNINTLKPITDSPMFRFVKADITDTAAVDKVFCEEKPDTVVNFAAESHVDRSIISPALFTYTNTIGTQVLADVCIKHNTPHFHQISTDEVYGDTAADKGCCTENAPLCPSNPYSASKAAADLLVLAYHRTYGLPVTVSRCTNNYGPYQHTEKLIPLMTVKALGGLPLPVYGDGSNIRNWLYVADHCSAVDMIIHHGKSGEIYNISGGEDMSNIDIVKLILSILGKDSSLIRFTADRKGHDRRYCIDSSKIRNELGWKPTVAFDDGIRQTVDWYKENRKWWNNNI